MTLEEAPARRVIHPLETAPQGTGPGRNQVPIYKASGTPADYRTYEIYQRERVHEATEKIRPIQLIEPQFAIDPYPVLTILRENYPCYRDWLGNSYWVTRYDDVTSIFADTANFETRPKRWYYRMPDLGRDLNGAIAVEEVFAATIDQEARSIAESIARSLVAQGPSDLALEFAARFPIAILARALDLPPGDLTWFAKHYWRMQRGFSFDERARVDGVAAIEALVDYLSPLLTRRRAKPGRDLLSVLAQLEPAGGPVEAADIVATLLERDHETLHGGLANLLALLLLHPEALERCRAERGMIKFAWLETLRHSPPVTSIKVYARHEVERFGRLLPEGGLIHLSAAAANRDPRQFADPERFILGRKDLCQREPRGQYRADGLASGIAFGLGRPSRHPAVPEDRPRSSYALTRDAAVAAINALFDASPSFALSPGSAPLSLRALRLGDMRACWRLPVTFAHT